MLFSDKFMVNLFLNDKCIILLITKRKNHEFNPCMFFHKWSNENKMHEFVKLRLVLYIA
jgi:hypothetical protein